MKKCVVIGSPVDHSLSPKMHNAGYQSLELDFIYEKIEVKPQDLSCFMKRVRTGEFVGISVTAPHKETVLQFADSLSPAAARIGAANTLFFSDGKLCAENTDWYGFVKSLQEILGQRGLQEFDYVISGAGGVARAVIYGLNNSGVSHKQIYVRNRTEIRAKELASEFGVNVFFAENFLKNKSVVFVNATSVPIDGVPWYADFVYDVNYKNDSIVNSEGKRMLLYQGVKQFEIFTGRTAPIDSMWNVIK